MTCYVPLVTQTDNPLHNANLFKVCAYKTSFELIFFQNYTNYVAEDQNLTNQKLENEINIRLKSFIITKPRFVCMRT